MSLNEPISEQSSVSEDSVIRDDLQKSFDLSYTQKHPAPTVQIAALEDTMIASAINDLVPFKKPKTIPMGKYTYGPYYEASSGVYTFPIEGADPVVMKFARATSGVSQAGAGVIIEQGKPEVSRPHDSHYYCNAQLIPVTAAMSTFQKGYGAFVPEYMREHRVREKLFPEGNQDYALSYDVRSVLPDGTRGHIRGGFAQELSYRYIDTYLRTVGSNRSLRYIYSIFNGDGTMSDLYKAFQQAKNDIKKEHPSMVQEQLQVLAAQKIRPFSDWGFTKFHVVELPEDTAKLVLISAEREQPTP
ncbi:MAG: hypothetical protein NUV98_03025 [Candidatus Roizmanbacteria bacterium]|nr:hypothetical protein [Candidatus Roizmanbacteria bacterium]